MRELVPQDRHELRNGNVRTHAEPLSSRPPAIASHPQSTVATRTTAAAAGRTSANAAVVAVETSLGRIRTRTLPSDCGSDPGTLAR